MRDKMKTDYSHTGPYPDKFVFDIKSWAELVVKADCGEMGCTVTLPHEYCYLYSIVQIRYSIVQIERYSIVQNDYCEELGIKKF